ncbi:hypothetical protein JVU11DRAFT_300 [Chiua virens]|nr:hypothetical protein JVU11DRAFT_300 [Chiua virens]
MAAVSHGTRHLRLGIGVHNVSNKHPSRSIHIPAFTPRPSSTAQRIFTETRTFFSRLISHATTFTHSHPPVAVPPQPSLFRPNQLSNSQNISARFSLPVKHALSRPFCPPRLPKPPTVPANVTQVGLGTARAFHSGRPIFQNIVDNVPIATRALWEAEWEVKTKKKEARRMHRATRNKTVSKSPEMLKPKPEPITTELHYAASELDVYFPVEPTPAVTTHLLVPLAPTPTGRLPLLTRTDGGHAHPLLPISDLVSLHTSHRFHSLRVSTLFARLDAANVWDDPGVNVDAYAFGPRHGTREKECTVLRVTFRGWSVGRVREILGDSAEEWYSLEETHLDGRPALVPLPDQRQDIATNTRPESPSRENVEVDSDCASKGEVDVGYDLPFSPPFRASASAQHDLVLPTLDFSSAFSDAADNTPQPPRPIILLRTVSELVNDAEQISHSSSMPTSNLSSVASPLGDSSWEWVGSSSYFLKRIGDSHRREVGMDM